MSSCFVHYDHVLTAHAQDLVRMHFSAEPSAHGGAVFQERSVHSGAAFRALLADSDSRGPPSRSPSFSGGMGALLRTVSGRLGGGGGGSMHGGGSWLGASSSVHRGAQPSTGRALNGRLAEMGGSAHGGGARLLLPRARSAQLAAADRSMHGGSSSGGAGKGAPAGREGPSAAADESPRGVVHAVTVGDDLEGLWGPSEHTTGSGLFSPFAEQALSSESLGGKSEGAGGGAGGREEGEGAIRGGSAFLQRALSSRSAGGKLGDGGGSGGGGEGEEKSARGGAAFLQRTLSARLTADKLGGRGGEERSARGGSAFLQRALSARSLGGRSMLGADDKSVRSGAAWPDASM